jgi:hypothetical protein
MAVLYRDLTFSSGVSTSVDDKGWITATAKMEFNVFVDNVLDNEGTVITYPTIPGDKSRHPYFPYLFCDSRDVQRQGPRHFVVTCTFKSAPYKDVPSGPLNEPTQISYFTIGTDGACEEDINGKPITTKCGELIYGVTRTFSDLGIRLSKNFASFDPPSFYLFINTVNSDTFLGFPPGTLWVASISADEQFFEDVPYWKVQVEIHARKPYRTSTERAWWVRYRHQGYRAFYDIGGNSVVLKVTRGGEPVTSPVLLDENGSEIPEDPNTEPTAVWLESQIYETRSFAAMGF